MKKIKKPLKPDDKRLGNKFAAGSTKSGTPRTVSPPPEDMIKIGQEMVKWVKENPKILHLSAWYAIEKDYLESQWETMKDRKEFIPYYEKALKIIAQKYLDKDSNVRDGISQRWQRIYFKDLRKEEDETKAFEYKLREKFAEFEQKIKNKVLEKVSVDVRDQFESLMNQITDLQNKRK